MRWYELAKIVHFMGLVALFGFFMINLRAGTRLRDATELSEVRRWLGVLEGARGSMHGGAGLMLISGIVMIALRWRGPYPFTAIGMLTLLAIWALSFVGARHRRAMQAAIPSTNGPIPDGLRAIILAPLPWAVTSAMNGAAAGVLVVMTWKPGWVGAVATIILAAVAGALSGNASVRRQRSTALAGRLSTAS